MYVHATAPWNTIIKAQYNTTLQEHHTIKLLVCGKRKELDDKCSRFAVFVWWSCMVVMYCTIVWPIYIISFCFILYIFSSFFSGCSIF